MLDYEHLVSSNSFTAILVATTLLLVYALYPRKRYRLPPEVPPLPEKERPRPWLYWTRMAQEAGSDIICYRQNGRRTVMLSSIETIYELLEKRSAIYSSRPPAVLVNVRRAGSSGPSMPYGDQWRRWRKVMQGALMAKQARNYQPLQQLESTVFMHDMLQSSEDWVAHIKACNTRSVCQISYGFRPVDVVNDPVIVAHYKSLVTLQQMSRRRGSGIVERWPFFVWTPPFLADIFLPALSNARAVYKHDTKIWKGLFDDVKVRMDKGDAAWSFSRDVWSKPFEEHGLSHLACAFAASVPFVAGISTQESLMTSFMFACAAQGELFLPRAQAELDALCGTDRLPTFQDLEEVPYIAAIGKEVFRWGNTTPSPIAHAVIKDDVVQDSYGHTYDIPGGTAIMPNYYPCNTDERYYPQADLFKPERFLPETSGEALPHPLPAIGHFGWGVGRRICPGRTTAEQAYSIIVARLIWAFDMSASEPVDKSEEAFVAQGPSRRPVKIPIVFKIRSEKHAKVIREEFLAVQPDLRAVEKR